MSMPVPDGARQKRAGSVCLTRGRGGLVLWVRAALVVALFALVLLVLGAGVLPGQAAAVPLPDYNEPNDSFPEARPLQSGMPVVGAITEPDDEDYFYIDLDQRSDVRVEFITRGYLRDGALAFQSRGSDMIVDLDWEHYNDDGSFVAEGTLGPGRLFVMIKLGRGTASTMPYQLTVTLGPVSGQGFPDVPPSSGYYQAVTYLAERGVVSGYQNGKFGIDDLVRRQQFAKMIVKGGGYDVSTSDECPFVDVDRSYPGHYLDPNDPLYPDHYVAVAYQHQITGGVGSSPKGPLYGPYDYIKLAQVVTMVVRAGVDLGVWDVQLPHSYVPPFEDFGEPHYSWACVGAAHGLFEGYPGGYNWYAPATRGQCAFFVWKLMRAWQVGAY